MKNKLLLLNFKLLYSKIISLFIIFFLLVPPLYGQQKTVTGKVTSLENDNGLPGVNVVEKGTNNGTVTDIQGNYSLEVSEGATLVFSSVGYTQEEVEVGNRSLIDLTMTQDIQQLQELVVVGYGTQKKQDLTGSVASIRSEELESIPLPSIESGMQGRVPGVVITQSNASPGGAMNVRIRGGNTVLGGNQPLFVIDGYPIYNSPPSFNGSSQSSNLLATINPNDIESIDVLKDASATAIYGARGANGVIIITTKRGNAGKGKINVNAYYGIQEVSNTYDLMGAKDFMTIANEKFEFLGLDVPYQDFNEYPNETDWQEEMFRIAPIQNYSISFSGGNEKNRYHITGNYFDQEGILINTGFKRGSVRLNLDNELNEKVKLSSNITLSRSNNNRSRTSTSATQNIIYFGLVAPPNVPVRNEDGSYVKINQFPGTDPTWDNPIFILNNFQNELESNRVLANTLFTYTFVDGLSLNIRLGTDFNYLLTEQYTPLSTVDQPNAGAMVANQNIFNFLNENTLSYKRIFNQIHSFDIVTGFTYQEEINKAFRQSNNGFITDIFGTNNLGSAEVINPNFSQKQVYSIVSWLGRINYSLADKYLFTFSARADGSSRFGKGNKWGIFPSAALAWRLSDEDFLKGFEALDNLKLRMSYGIVGNQEIGLYQSLNRLSSGLALFGINETSFIGFSPAEIGNPDLKWETTSQVNTGFDVGFINSRFTLTFDYYYKITRDLLAPVNLPPSSGFTSVLRNLGEISNEGIEVGLNANIINNNKINFNIGGNIATNENIVRKWINEQDFAPDVGFPVSQSINIIKEGEQLSSFYGFVEDGLTDDGLIAYKDLDENGIIDANDRTILGKPFPNLNYGVNTSLTIGNFDIGLFFIGQSGSSLFNFNSYILGDSFARESNQFKVVNQRWTVENPDPNAPYPRVSSTAPLVSDRHIQDASFFRLRNLSIGYNLPVSLNWLSNARIYFNGQNLFTVTNYNGFDPEISTFDLNDLRKGIDFGAYPNARTFTVGLNLEF